MGRIGLLTAALLAGSAWADEAVDVQVLQVRSATVAMTAQLRGDNVGNPAAVRRG